MASSTHSNGSAYMRMLTCVLLTGQARSCGWPRPALRVHLAQLGGTESSGGGCKQRGGAAAEGVAEQQHGAEGAAGSAACQTAAAASICVRLFVL